MREQNSVTELTLMPEWLPQVRLPYNQVPLMMVVMMSVNNQSNKSFSVRNSVVHLVSQENKLMFPCAFSPLK